MTQFAVKEHIQLFNPRHGLHYRHVIRDVKKNIIWLHAVGLKNATLKKRV
jgi:hypothetical protein